MRTTICVIGLAVTVACAFPIERPRVRTAADRYPAAKPRRQIPLESQKGDDVDDYIQKSMARQHIPGLSLVVVKDGEIRKIRGYGLASLELNVPVKPETVYELASTTKPFVAMATMMLVQDGKITLDDRISKYVKGTPDSWKNITIRHLLSHTSGVKDYLKDLRRDFSFDAPPEAIIKVAIDAPLNFEPGQQWSYSNTGYVLLAAIIRTVSGKPYDAFLAERIFKPLGMSATRHDSPDEIIPDRAVGYLWQGGTLHNGDFLKFMMTNHGDRGILSTAHDLAKWDIAFETDRFLAAPVKEAMWTQAKLADGKSCGYGLGWFVDKVNGHRHVHHAGGAPGTATIIARYPDDRLTVILLANSSGGAYVQGLEFGVAQRYVPGLVSREVVKLSPEELDSCTGYYNAFGSQLLRVSRDGYGLVLDDGGQLVNTFLPLSGSRFVAEDADRGFTLNRNKKGELLGMTLRLIRDEMPVQRIGPFARSLEARSGPDSAVTRKLEAVLKAFAQGGKSVEAADGIAPQARKDYSRGPSPELSGIQSSAFIAEQDVSEKGIERHAAKVTRVLYFKLVTGSGTRYVLVYLTADGLVTDQDVVSD
jgi:D-alanyl-D-alanine carboxypeptidase